MKNIVNKLKTGLKIGILASGIFLGEKTLGQEVNRDKKYTEFINFIKNNREMEVYNTSQDTSYFYFTEINNPETKEKYRYQVNLETINKRWNSKTFKFDKVNAWDLSVDKYSDYKRGHLIKNHWHFNDKNINGLNVNDKTDYYDYYFLEKKLFKKEKHETGIKSFSEFSSETQKMISEEYEKILNEIMDDKKNNNSQDTLTNKISQEKTILVSNDFINLLVYDYGTVDGDTVDYYLDNKLVKEDIGLEKTPFEISINHKKGLEEEIMFLAKSVGSLPPCTIKVQIQETGETFRMGAKKGEIMKIKLK